MTEQEWLLFLSQLPASPSSLRVMIWRRMRMAGAASLQNGVWVLPRTPQQEEFVQSLLDYVVQQGSTGQVFIVHALNSEVEADLIARFQADRDQEYAELIEQCEDMLSELRKETQQKKFTFAELEENEQNLERLKNWMKRIQDRDYFGAPKTSQALEALEACEQAIHKFADQIYGQEGLNGLGGKI